MKKGYVMPNTKEQIHFKNDISLYDLLNFRT
jgi:hypothetical protein